jgi:hypothetical protein
MRNDWQVTLVTLYGKPITIGVGGHTFEIKNDTVMDNTEQRLGSNMNVVYDPTGADLPQILPDPEKLKRYEQCFELAKFAWEAKEFDNTETH